MRATGTAFCLAVAALFAAANATSTQRRSLLYYYGYAKGNTTLYTPTDSGGISVVANYSLTLRPTSTYSYSYPPPSRTPAIAPSSALIQKPLSFNGYVVEVNPGGVNSSKIFKNAGCVTASIKTNSSQVVAFLTTYKDYTAIQGKYSFILDDNNIVGGLNLNSTTPGPALAATQPDVEYVLAFYSLDKTKQSATYQYTAYPRNAPECGSAGPAGSDSPSPPPTGPSGGPPRTRAPAPVGSRTGRKLRQSGASGPASATPTSLTQTAQINDLRILKYGDLFPVAAFTNASCIAYKLQGQPELVDEFNLIDVSVFLLDEPTTTVWAIQNFNKDAVTSSRTAACYQNNTFSGPCLAHTDNLNPTKVYFLWAVFGINLWHGYPDPAPLNLAFTAQTSGSCGNNAINLFQDNVDFGEDVAEVDYDYDYNDYFYNYDYSYDYN